MSPRTPLLRPGRFFADRAHRIGSELAVVALVTAALVAATLGMGWVLADRVDGTVAVDNPDRPPDAICENAVLDHAGCDEPREVERSVDALIWEVVTRVAVQFVWTIPLSWLLVGLLLHGGSWLVGGSGGAARSLAVAAWGMTPSILAIVVGLAVLAVTFDPVTVTPAGDPAAFEAQFLGQLRALRMAGIVLGVVTTGWSAVIWRFGLEHWRRVPGPAAAGVAALVAFVLLLFGLA